ncbi:MAG: hypothetical protein EKK53_19475 [Burkholderiales bacterium]|nr:MAG: hypothetical protein EKK53_19475 [Burkholderiales bacterium]
MDYRITSDRRGFCAEVEGYLCFVKPILAEGALLWQWSIQSGGGWTGRGGRDVHQHAEGVEISAQDAEDAMHAWIEDPKKPSLALVK